MANTRNSHTHQDFSYLLHSTGQIVKCMKGKESVLATCFKISDHYFMTAGLEARDQRFQPIDRNIFAAQHDLFIKFNIENVTYYCKAKISHSGRFYIPHNFTYAILELTQPLPAALSLQSVKINLESCSKDDEVVTVNYGAQGQKVLSSGNVLNPESPQLYFFSENNSGFDPWAPRSKPKMCYADFIKHSAEIQDEATGSPLVSKKSQEVIGISIQFPKIAKNGYFALPIKKLMDEAIERDASWLPEIGIIKKPKHTLSVDSLNQKNNDDKEVKVSQSSLFSANCMKGIAIGVTGIGVSWYLYRRFAK